MTRGAKVIGLGLFLIVLAASLVMGGCSRYANEKQMTQLEESKAATLEAEEKVAQLEKEKAELEAKLASKKQELQDVQAEKEKVKEKLGQ
ncbi:hypothetical protein JW906_08065 [bacterium]|nr:hypothetical protein [bacterium]